MKATLPPLVIVEPCTAAWDAMPGSEQRRFCTLCQRSVHNLSAMTATEQRRFAERTGGRECIAYVPVGDGRILTRTWREVFARSLRPLRWTLAWLLPMLAGSCVSRESAGPLPALPGRPGPLPTNAKQLRGRDADGVALLGSPQPVPGKPAMVRGRARAVE